MFDVLRWVGEQVPRVFEDDVEAISWYRLSADQGFAAARYNLGAMYDHGDGVREDDVEAVRWYRLAADQGFPAAQYNLGVMYHEGSGIGQNLAEAARWYLLAAEQGYALAQFALGMMHSRGDGVRRSEAEAIRWYALAAEQGDALAQTNLGVILAQRWYRTQREALQDPVARAILGPDDLTLAFKWLTLAAGQDNATARSNLAVLEEWLTPEQMVEARRLAQEWLDRRAQLPEPRAETIREPRR